MKNYTLEEMEAQYKDLGEKIKQKRQEEEDRKKAELALTKEARKKELDEAREQYLNLLQEYIRDYHSYEGIYSNENSPLSKIFEFFM